jgi:PAS domain S-box-containing protein
MTDLSIRTRFIVLMALLLASMAAAAGFALFQLRGVTLSVQTVYADRVLPLLQLRTVANAYLTTMPSVAQQVRDGHLDATAATAELNRTQLEARAQWARYKATYLVPQEKALVAEAEPLLARAQLLHEKLVALLAQRDLNGLRAFLANEQYALSRPLDSVFDRLVAVQADEAAAEAEASRGTYRAAVWGLLALLALALALGAGLAWAMVLRYARDRRAGEEAALHQARCYAALSRTNQMILRAQDTQTLFEEICRICVDTNLARVAYVLQLEGDRGVVAGSAGPAKELLSGILLKLESDGPMSRLPVARALREGVHVISNDYLNDEHTAVLHEHALQQGVRAMGAFPIRRGGAVIGSLNLYVEEVGFFDETRVQLLDEMAGDLSFALDNINRDAARVLAEQEAEAGYARLRQVFNLMPVAILLVSRKTDLVITANATCGKRYGMSPEAMVGRSMNEMGLGFWPADRARFDAELDAKHSVHEFEAHVRVAGGAEMDLLTSAAVIDYQGEPCRLTVSLDITERKRREQAERAQFDAEASSSAKTDFLSRMSHELRTPLNAVLGFSQLMQADRQEPLTDRQRARVESIRQAGWHLLALINDVLDVSRIESGHLQVESRGVDLTGLLDEVLDLVRSQADSTGIVIDAAYRLGPPAIVQGDPLRLRQVMLNLLSNALKYNRPKGSVRVAVATQGTDAIVEIADTGLGMTPAQLERLFEPFNRLGREHSAIEGTGIGLALTRQLVTLMDGRIDVESEVSRGTTVKVTLPLGEALSQRSELDASGQTGAPVDDATGSPEGVVLYVEDNPINAMLVEQLMLGWPGIRLVQAENGQRGIELARALHPDLVLLDMRLPDMDGPQVLRTLRADPGTQDIRVIALSASAMPDEVALARECGAFDYWTKPLDFERFMANLKGLLKRA